MVREPSLRLANCIFDSSHRRPLLGIRRVASAGFWVTAVDTCRRIRPTAGRGLCRCAESAELRTWRRGGSDGG